MAKTKEQVKQAQAEDEQEATREAISRRRQKLSGTKVMVSFGKLRELQDFETPGFEIRPNSFLENPAELLKNPEPGARYSWPNADDPGTQARIRQGDYEKVKASELLKNNAAPITHEGTDGDVRWYTLVLVKESALMAKRRHAQAGINLTRLAQREESYKADVEAVSQGKAVGTASITETG